MMFNWGEHKPISIGITILRSRAYNKETLVFDALINVATNMHNYIENRFDSNIWRVIKWIPNPVNLCREFC